MFWLRQTKQILSPLALLWGFPGGSDGKESPHNERDPGLAPGLGRSQGEGNGSPLQYSCLENSMDRGACWAAVHGVVESWTWLQWLSIHEQSRGENQALHCACLDSGSFYSADKDYLCLLSIVFRWCRNLGKSDPGRLSDAFFQIGNVNYLHISMPR